MQLKKEKIQKQFKKRCDLIKFKQRLAAPVMAN